MERMMPEFSGTLIHRPRKPYRWAVVALWTSSRLAGWLPATKRRRRFCAGHLN